MVDDFSGKLKVADPVFNYAQELERRSWHTVLQELHEKWITAINHRSMGGVSMVEAAALIIVSS